MSGDEIAQRLYDIAVDARYRPQPIGAQEALLADARDLLNRERPA